MSVTDRSFNPSGSEAVDAIKAKVLELEDLILENSPQSRLQAIALTELEGASMWAVKAVIVGEEE